MSGNVEHVSPCFSCGRVCPVRRMLEVADGADCTERFNMKTGFVKTTVVTLMGLLHTKRISTKSDYEIIKRGRKYGYEVKIRHDEDDPGAKRFYYVRENERNDEVPD